MDVRFFPHSSPARSARDDAVDIDHLLTLTNSRLLRLTGNPDVIATRLGLRQLRKLGLRALVYGRVDDLGRSDAPACANDETATGT